MKGSDWSEEDLKAFLARLVPTADEAGPAYERLHRKLEMLFENRPGTAADSSELADQTIDRVIRKLRENPAFVPQDIHSYVLGFARNVYREYARKPRPAPLDFEAPDPFSLTVNDLDSDLRLGCLRRCLTHLSKEEYDSVLAYYSAEKRENIELRSQTAASLNKSRGALSVSVFRIRRKLEACIGRCLKNGRNVILSKNPPDYNSGRGI